MQYSLTKGIKKGLTALIPIAVALVTFAGFSDVTLWGLLEQYVKPILGGTTIVGVLTVVLNWAKFKAKARSK